MPEKSLLHPYERYSPSAPIDRPLPKLPWPRLALFTTLATLILVASWELTARSWGYAPSYNDTSDLWAIARDRVQPESLVVIGGSRSLFDFDGATLARGLGREPLFLGNVGSTAGPIFHDLAVDPDFRGDVIFEVTLPLVFAPGGPTVEASLERLAYRRERTLSQRAGHFLARRLEEHLAFLKEEDLTLRQMLARIPLENRAGSAIPPREPPYIAAMRLDRTYALTQRILDDRPFREQIQRAWIALLSAAPPMSEEERVAARDAVLAALKADVARLRQRGGRVIFVRPLVTGGFLELENKMTPRADYWERLLRETGVPGIAFDDHPELAAFDCPEWSHLTPADAILFTERLIPLLRERALAPR